MTNELTALRAAGDQRIATEEAATLLERDYALWQRETIAAMVGTENALTGKPHSFSSATDAIKTLADYHRWTAQIDKVRLDRLRALIDYEIALEALRSARAIAGTEGA